MTSVMEPGGVCVGFLQRLPSTRKCRDLAFSKVNLNFGAPANDPLERQLPAQWCLIDMEQVAGAKALESTVYIAHAPCIGQPPMIVALVSGVSVPVTLRLTRAPWLLTLPEA